MMSMVMWIEVAGLATAGLVASAVAASGGENPQRQGGTEVATLADKAMLLYRGYTLAEGPVRELFSDLPLLAKAELGAPFAGGLAAALQARGIALGHTPLTAAEAEEELWQAWKG